MIAEGRPPSTSGAQDPPLGPVFQCKEICPRSGRPLTERPCLSKPSLPFLAVSILYPLIDTLLLVHLQPAVCVLLLCVIPRAGVPQNAL